MLTLVEAGNKDEDDDDDDEEEEEEEIWRSLPAGSKLYRSVPRKSVGSWATMLKLRRKRCKSKVR
jgi:hypothetical protein